LRAGLTRHEIAQRIADGSLIVVHRGVYGVGHVAPSLESRYAGTHFVDCRWPAARLTVGLDSYRYHGSRHAWQQDRRREREARARGDEFLRYTWADVYEEPAAMLRELRGLLQGSIRPRRIA
jgi:hypothetical protein